MVPSCVVHEPGTCAHVRNAPVIGGTPPARILLAAHKRTLLDSRPRYPPQFGFARDTYIAQLRNSTAIPRIFPGFMNFHPDL